MAIFRILQGRVLARNSVINLIGQITPMAAALVAIPLLIKGVGIERFGFITIAWMIIGYFSLFDMGLGRALTQLVAKKLGSDEEDEIPAISWTALILMGLLACFGTIILLLTAPWIVSTALKIPDHLTREATISIYILAFSPPIVILTTGLRGLLEAHQCFTAINAIRIPLGLYSYLAPLAVLPFSHSLIPIIAVLMVGRLIAGIAHFLICIKSLPDFDTKIHFDRSYIKTLLGFGGWMTVSNIAAPLMLYLDRFIICSLVSLEAVAYYTTPFDVVTKLWLVPAAIMGVLFPAFSSSYFTDRKRTIELYFKSLRYLLLLLFPTTLILIIFARLGLTAWIGEDFALQSYRVTQFLSLGVLISCMAQPSFNLIQAAGKPHITAITHVVELPLYLGYLWVLVHQYGILGAAIAWVIRVSISFIILTSFAFFLLKQKEKK